MRLKLAAGGWRHRAGRIDGVEPAPAATDDEEIVIKKIRGKNKSIWFVDIKILGQMTLRNLFEHVRVFSRPHHHPTWASKLADCFKQCKKPALIVGMARAAGDVTSCFLDAGMQKKNTSRANHYFNGGGSPGSNQSYICSDLAATRLHRLLSLHAMRAIC